MAGNHIGERYRLQAKRLVEVKWLVAECSDEIHGSWKREGETTAGILALIHN